MNFFAVLRPVSFSLALVSLLAAPSAAQLRHPGQPAAGLLGGPPVYESQIPNVAQLRAEDVAARSSGEVTPLRFGTFMPMTLPFSELAQWQASADGTQLAARLQLRAPGSFSISVEFSSYELPAEGKLFAYTPDKSRVLGAFTRANRIDNGEFVIEPMKGETIVLEYTQPIDLEVRPDIVIKGLTYDYADLFRMQGGLTPFAGEGGSEGGCNVGANCPEAAPFPELRRAAVRTIFQGALCSAATINNTSNDGEGYLYTANHCGTGSNVVMYFNYEQTGCDTGPADSSQTLVGATLLANDLDTDGRLMRINPNLPEAYQPFLAGWSRSSANMQFGVGFHHPGGAPKNVSIDNNGGGQGTSNFIGIGPVKVWNMTFQVGGTAGGSSGSPIYDENDRIRGTLTGGPSQCNVSRYGRFHSFWNESNIAQWLDPLGTNQTTLDGFDVFGDLVPANITSVTPNSGPAGGFTPVAIGGSGFDGVDSVTFDGVEALSFEVLSNSSIIAVAPGGSQGAVVDVAVTDDFGVEVQNNSFSYTSNPAPSITAIDPVSATLGGGDEAFLTGPNVVGITSVEFGGVPSPSVEVLDTTTLRVIVPANTGVGPVDVVAFGNGTDVLLDGFAYFNPGEFVTFGVSDGPTLSGTGSTIPDDPTGFTLSLSLGFSQPAALFVSLTETAVPFKQGLLYPVPVLIQLNFNTVLFGNTNLGPIVMPGTVPSGTVLITQAALQSAGAPGGVAMSNGLRVIVGED